MTEPDTNTALQSELLRLDILLRKKQTIWETPRAIFGIATAVFIAGAAVGAALITGFSRPHPVIVQFGGEPLKVQITPEKLP